MTKEEPDRKKEAFSQLMAVLVVAVLVLPVALLLTGLVAGWEGVRPMVENLLEWLAGAVLLAFGLVLAGVAAAFGYGLGDMGAAPAWFDRSIGRTCLWVAAVVLLTVAPQCLIVPWVARNGVPDSSESSVKYALLWNPPNLSGQLSKYGPIEDLPTRVSGGLLALQLFCTGVFLVFYGRYLLRNHEELDKWNFIVGPGVVLCENPAHMLVKLGKITHLFAGLQTDADDVFIVHEIKKSGPHVLCRSRATEKEHWFEDNHLEPFLKGYMEGSLNVRRYHLGDVTKRLIFPYANRNGKSELIQPKDYKRQYPLTWAYLEANRERLAQRNKGRMGPDWYGYVYKKNHTRFGLPKLVTPSLTTGSYFAPDLDGQYFFGEGGYGISLNEDINFSPLYLLGVLNSTLLSAATKATSSRDDYVEDCPCIEWLPIRTIDFSDSADKLAHDRMVKMVDSMLSLHSQIAAAKSAAQKDIIQRQIDATDREIDRLVYELYGLTAEEIAIVEGKEQ